MAKHRRLDQRRNDPDAGGVRKRVCDENDYFDFSGAIIVRKPDAHHLTLPRRITK
jgi:hypothetical protein